MAERRMFSQTIIDSDAFLDMSSSAQALYFHLGVKAQDGGKINNIYATTRTTNLTTDDIDELEECGFIKPSSDGTYHIVHWEENNGTAENSRKRLSYKYRQWRKEILERDDFTCRVCYATEKVMHVHHIKPFSTYPEMRYDPDNAITLCPKCHLDIHGGRWNNG